MAEKRKISIRKVLQVLLTIVVSTCCVIAMVSASKIEGEKNLASVVVHIKNDKKYHFIEQKEIMDLAINNRHVDIMHTPLSKLDIHGIEQVIKSDPWVAEAQAFIDMNRVLHMYVTQRIPVARLFEQDSKSYYMDGTLSTMPLSATNIYYTMVVTNVPQLGNDSAGIGVKKQIYALARAIQADTFWNAQVSQIVIDSPGMFELVTVIGNQKIIFGDTSDAREKLNNLFSFYKNVLNRIGWDKYETLDLRFKGQVVAAPSLPYKGVSDKAVDKMNWINSIIITEAQNDSRDSLKTADIKGLTGGSVSVAAKAADAKPAIGKVTIAKAAVVAGGVGAGLLLAKQLKKPAAVAATKKTPPTQVKGQAVAKQPVKPVVLGKQTPGVKPGLKPPSAPFGKGTVVAKPTTIAKTDDKHKKAVTAADKKKAIAKKKQADAKRAKARAKNAKVKQAQKKNVKAVNSKKDIKTSKDKKPVTPKYAYPENKGH